MSDGLVSLYPACAANTLSMSMEQGLTGAAADARASFPLKVKPEKIFITNCSISEFALWRKTVV
jgi:hypothetical protein